MPTTNLEIPYQYQATVRYSDHSQEQVLIQELVSVSISDITEKSQLSAKLEMTNNLKTDIYTSGSNSFMSLYTLSSKAGYPASLLKKEIELMQFPVIGYTPYATEEDKQKTLILKETLDFKIRKNKILDISFDKAERNANLKMAKEYFEPLSIINGQLVRLKDTEPFIIIHKKTLNTQLRFTKLNELEKKQYEVFNLSDRSSTLTFIEQSLKNKKESQQVLEAIKLSAIDTYQRTIDRIVMCDPDALLIPTNKIVLQPIDNPFDIITSYQLQSY